MGIILELMFDFLHYTTNIRPWQLPNIDMDFRYLEEKLRNCKEKYAFTEIKCGITNFPVGIWCLLALNVMYQMNGAANLYIPLLLRNNLQWNMDCAKYSIKRQNDY